MKKEAESILGIGKRLFVWYQKMRREVDGRKGCSKW